MAQVEQLRGKYEFIYEKDVEENQTGEKKSTTTVLSNKENAFKIAAKEQKAIKNFAASQRPPIKPYNKVDIEQVRQSKLGIDGWAKAGTPPTTAPNVQRRNGLRRDISELSDEAASKAAKAAKAAKTAKAAKSLKGCQGAFNKRQSWRCG